MKRAILILATLAVLAIQADSFAGSGGSSVSRSKGSSNWVRGYTKKNGTHVQSYKKTSPDKWKSNNYSASRSKRSTSKKK